MWIFKVKRWESKSMIGLFEETKVFKAGVEKRQKRSGISDLRGKIPEKNIYVQELGKIFFFYCIK